jgi:hypothetical protein
MNEEQKHTPEPSLHLEQAVMEKIENEHVAQVPRWKFVLSEYGIWILWGFSVFVGALSFAVILFFITHAGFSFYEATHEDISHFMIEVLPYLWFLLFALMAILAHYNLRHTKRGYRFEVWQVLVSSIAASFVGGLLLHTIGVGFLVDDFVAKRMPMVPTLERIEMHMWQSPEKGRMIGIYQGDGDSDEDDVVIITDDAGTTWKLDTSELPPPDLATLFSGERVRIIGLPSPTMEGYFVGCNVFPWLLNKEVTFEDMRTEREDFLAKMRAHQENMIDTLLASGTVPGFIARSLCATHEAVVRTGRAGG